MQSRRTGEPADDESDRDDDPFEDLPSYDVIDGELLPRGTVVQGRSAAG